MASLQGKTKYQQQLKNNESRSRPGAGSGRSNLFDRKVIGESSEKTKQRILGDQIDSIFGFVRLTEGQPKIGWLLNYMPTTMPDSSGQEKAGVDLYFIDRNGENFKASLFYQPYFYLDISDGQRMMEVCNFLMRKFEGCVANIESREDLDLPNHLSGLQHSFVKLSFNTVSELMDAKSSLRSRIDQNRAKLEGEENIEEFLDNQRRIASNSNASDPLDCIIDIREYDVPYTMRVAIDLDIRIGAWFKVTPEMGSSTCEVEWQKDMLELCEPRILAFDIECEKSPLKFPNAENDKVFMISYMFCNQGYLIINREVVSEDIQDFEYTPKPHYPGHFKVFNVANEEEVLKLFLKHIQELKPHIIVTYNGDKFDWPYLDIRCTKYTGLSLFKMLGISSSSGNAPVTVLADNQYTGRCIVHLDAFCWVQRDSYLPQGNQGLKAVTKHKLGYDPVEVDPEDMVRFAKERPHHMASYSVSDAVATYYLYTTYVHNFIFSLSTIIPMGSEDVLRKGSGTLCEALLMVEAYKGNIVCPNKQVDPNESFYDGHLLESETYIGGHVECLEAGVFRADIPVKFNMVPSAFQQLIDNIDRDLAFALEVEHGIQRSDAVNYDDVRQAVVEKLELLRDYPERIEAPLIYHLDVGAMYPNIILTNRLQPSSIVDLHDCASCKFNQSINDCKRPMTWLWRGDFSPAGMTEYNGVRTQLSYEKISGTSKTNAIPRSFMELSRKEQADLVKARLKTYSQKVYRKTKVTKVEERTSTVCMRENSFYVDTVKAFRDRRYDYKLLTKTWKGKKNEAEKKGDAVARKQAEDREILMDSLQLAHKCILNSFYGYVMRKGARWRSMEMAGIVTHTGAQLIKQARELVEQVGRPLELDTDGIWCILPVSFPQNFKLKIKNGATVSIGYPCAMLNADVHERYTNHQYQVLESSGDKGNRYLTQSECSIFFELDGPYKAMCLPASPEEGKLLKKKYVVFNFDGSIAELKGFELKRRGELELVKIFQAQVFEQFLAGNTLEECYAAVGDIANQWLDVLDSQGENMDDEELLELISERKTISKTVDDYEGRKSTSLTTAARLADFLGADMIKDKGLNCNLVMSRLPLDAPVTERAIPVAIFSCESAMRRYFLRKWLKDNTLDCDNFRSVIDWNYYKERLGKAIQKIVTIPAGMQRVANPCPRVEHPIWLQREMTAKASGKKQLSIKDAFSSMTIKEPHTIATAKGVMKYLETTSASAASPNGAQSATTSRKRVNFAVDDSNEESTINVPQMLPEETPSVDITEEGSHNANEIQPLSTFNPETEEELKIWLRGRKSQWRARRAARKSAAGAAGAREYSSKKAGNVLDFVKQATLNAQYGTWQILELQELDSPGEFLIWAMTSPTQLQRLQLTAPRVLIVNIASDGLDAVAAAEKLGGQRISRELPHGKEGLALFEIQLPEGKFQRNEKKLDTFFSSSSVEGVYESQVPLSFKAILNIGCVAKVSQSTLNSRINGKYQLHDLEIVHTRSHPYLDRKSSQFKKVFVYFAASKSRAAGVFGILGVFFIKQNSTEEAELLRQFSAVVDELSWNPNPAEASAHDGNRPPLSARAYVWIINGRTTMNALDAKPPLNKIYRKFQKNPHEEVKFTSFVVADSETALRLANDRLEQYYRERAGPSIVIAQGGSHLSENTSGSFHGIDARKWRSLMPALYDFPLAVMPANSLDEAFPAVGWNIFAAERMVQRFLLFPRWFDDRLKCSRYAQIPLCNLSNDALTTMIDVNYARHLIHNRHVLWASEEANCPDIGQGLYGSQDTWALWSDALPEPVINEPGVYRTFCIELDLYGLAICAIMNSADFGADNVIIPNTSNNNASKQTPMDADADAVDNNPILTHSAAAYSDQGCMRAFGVLKAMIAQFVDEVARRGDPIADSILTAIYRYLCGYGNGLLSDPQLHRTVYGYMIKLFVKLVACFRSLGAQIIHADFNRIIVATKCFDLPSASEYIDFILTAISLKKSFSFLQVSVKAFWRQLIWLEPENWAGLGIVEEKGEDPTQEEVQSPELAEAEGDTTQDTVTIERGLTHSVAEKTPAPHSEPAPRATSAPRPSKDKSKASDDEFFKELNDGADYDLSKIKRDAKKQRQSQSQSQQKSRHSLSYSDGEEDDYDDEGYDRYGEGDYYDDDEDDDDDNAMYPSFNNSSRRAAKYSSLDDLLDSFDAQDAAAKARAEEDNDFQQLDEEADLGIVQHWNMISSLPSSASTYFHFIVGEFILQYSQRLQEIKEYVAKAADFSLSSEEMMNSSYAHLTTDETIVQETEEQLQRWIQQEFTSKMFEIIDDLNFTYAVGRQSGDASQLVSKSLALDFVKSVTHVLLLDKRQKEVLSTVRRLLLAQLQIPEFSEESKFVNPNLSFVLHDVICSYCSMCRDIDLLRDETLVAPDESRAWRCSHCANSLNKEEAENRLLEELDLKVASFLVQDFRCKRTHHVSQRLATSFSTLSEPLEMDFTPDELRKHLNTLLQVANLHGFEFLKEAVEQMLGINRES